LYHKKILRISDYETTVIKSKIPFIAIMKQVSQNYD